MESFNVAHALTQRATNEPFRPAVILPAGRDRNGRGRFSQYSFAQLNALCDRYARGISDYGVRPGQRVLLMIRPGIELIAVVFALMKMGAVPVLIDPGMGRKAFLQCVSESEADALIGIPIAHLMRRLFAKRFTRVSRAVVIGHRGFLGAVPLEALAPVQASFDAVDSNPEDAAAIAFTSGSTGIPKGVVYSHGVFRAQVETMRKDMDIREGDVHLSAVYIFALFNPALGVTTVIPDMDPAQPARVNPAYLVETVQTFGVTFSLGSPTIWRQVAYYCGEQAIQLPSLRQIFMFGAPCPPELVEQCAALLPNGRVYTPFGATEALPLTLIDDREIVNDTSAKTENGDGVCVGRPIGDADIRIIPISDEPIKQWDEALALPLETMGEIVVKGAVVTREYLHRPEQTALAKIPDKQGFWHRMGDIGYLDASGRLWFCGRKSHRVETTRGLMLPVPCEAILNRHPAVLRTALVGVGDYGNQRPVLVVEARGRLSGSARERLRRDLILFAATHALTQDIDTVLFHGPFPVDVRHNAKIQREKLAHWAAEQLT